MNKSNHNFKKEDLSGFIEIIKTGSKIEVKEAKKMIELFYHDFYKENRKEGREAFEQFIDEIHHFDDICDIEHQAYFISSLKWAVWIINDMGIDTMIEFILKCIEHPSGVIRQQIIHIANHLSIDFDLPGRGSFENEFTGKVLLNVQLIKLIEFGLYVYFIENLLSKYSKPKFKKYKYIADMPVSEYKSLQKLMTEAVLRSDHYDNIYEWFLHFFEGRLQSIYSGNYSSDLKLLLSLLDKDDHEVIGLIIKSQKEEDF